MGKITEGSIEWYRAVLNQIINGDMTIYQNQKDCLDLLLNMNIDLPFNKNQEARKMAMKVSQYSHNIAEKCAALTGSGDFDDIYWQYLLLEAPHLFESYLLYMEKNRPDSKKFYIPRKKTLHVVAKDLQDLEERKIEFYGLSLPSRVGKAISYDTPVLTDNGWKKHGELTILDRVIGIDGEFKKILAIHNPCDMEYKVTFSDGEEIVCHGNHEWRVFDRYKRRIIDKETKEIRETLLEKDGRSRYYIPNKEMICGFHKPLWVSPYALGAWLGDGRNQNPDICGAESDYAIVQKIIDDGYELAWDTKHKTTGVRYYGFKYLRQDLQKYGMCHSRRRVSKYIPDEYLIADIDQRLELLAGLLDTDGSLNKKEHRYQFSTNEKTLRDGVISLVNSFGWRTTVVRYESGMSSSGIYANKPYWVVSFNPTMYIPCQLERKQLHEFSKQRMVSIKKIEKIEHPIGGNCITVEDGIYCVGKTLKPTHNSTMCIFFMSWIMGKRPNSHSAMGGHSGKLAKGFYGELLNLINTQEYNYSEIFPQSKLQKQSADDFEINLDKPDRFATMTCRGIEGTWTGAVDISSDGYLYVDDLVRDRQHSLSPTRLENTYQEYLNKMVDRKIDGARELMVGTRWNLYDPLGKIEKLNHDNPMYRFRKIPALNDEGKSNFDYEYGVGFSTKYYVDMKARLDANEWEAKYQQKPFLREGIVFAADELRYYNGVLPEGGFVKNVSACDVAWGGGDSLSMPVGAEYENGDVYIYDWIFSTAPKEGTLPLVVGRIMGNNIQSINFEANNGGDMYAYYVNERLKEHKYACSTTSTKAPSKQAKKEKINQYSGDVKQNFIFLAPKYQNKQYQKAMDELTTFVYIGDNEHDDAADGVTQLAITLAGKRFAEVKATKNFMWGRR